MPSVCAKSNKFCMGTHPRHWVCAQCKFIAFGTTEGIGCVPKAIIYCFWHNPMPSVVPLGVCPCKIYCFWQNRRHWLCAHSKFITFGTTEGIGCVPMQNLLLLAQLKALGVCPCRIYYFWHNRRHWVCAHAEFITFGRTGGIGCVPMRIYCFWQNRRHWVCAHAKFIAFGTTEGIG